LEGVQRRCKSKRKTLGNSLTSATTDHEDVASSSPSAHVYDDVWTARTVTLRSCNRSSSELGTVCVHIAYQLITRHHFRPTTHGSAPTPRRLSRYVLTPVCTPFRSSILIMKFMKLFAKLTDLITLYGPDRIVYSIGPYMQFVLCMYTVSQKNKTLDFFYHNFGKFEPIFKIISQPYS